MNEVVYKPIQDLGMASYLMMLGYKVSSRQERSVIFEVNSRDVEDFEDKETEYLQSDFHRFDSCLMSLKKMRISVNKNY